MFFDFPPINIVELSMMHWDTQIFERILPSIASKEFDILIFKLFRLSITKDFTFMKIYLKTRHLFKNTQQKFHIFCLFDVMVQKNDGIICILQNRQAIIHQVWYNTTDLSIVLSSFNQNCQHICNYIKQDWRHRIALSKPPLSLEVMTNVIIDLNPNTPPP